MAAQGEAGQAVPGFGEARTAVMAAADALAAAAAALYGVGERLRGPAFDEAVVEYERERAAGEALAAAGVPRPRARAGLHVVS